MEEGEVERESGADSEREKKKTRPTPPHAPLGRPASSSMTFVLLICERVRPLRV